MSCMGYSWPYPALVAPNGLISVDLGWIWVGYIQDGLLAPFGPTKIAIGGPWGGSGIAQKCHKSGISCHKWPWWLQMAGYQWILVGHIQHG